MSQNYNKLLNSKSITSCEISQIQNLDISNIKDTIKPEKLELMEEKIKIFLKQNWFPVAIIIFLLVVLSSSFYWYEWRPAQIRKDCVKKITKHAQELNLHAYEDFEFVLNYCLKLRGLSK